MSVPATDHARNERLRTWLPVLVALGAFAIGMLIFLALWLNQRGDNDFYRADSTTERSEGRQFEPLPTPMSQPEGRREGNASGMGETPARSRDPAPEIVDIPPPPAAPVPPIEQRSASPAFQGPDSAPQAIRSPAPRYPRSAQRRGESGTVVMRVHVTAEGRVADIDLVQSSQSRSLDRAANDAVRRWRFRPAMRDGRPVAGLVQVPIDFNLQR